MPTTFTQTKDIKQFTPLIDSLIPDFDFVFLHTILQWCELAHDPYKSQGQFWKVWLFQKHKNLNVYQTIGICGLYSLKPHTTDKLWLGWLAIIPQERNQGYGTRIMKHLYNECQKAGCKELLSYVDKEGKPLPFYKKEGFKVLGTVKEYLLQNKMDKIDGSDFENENDFVISKKLI